MEVLAVLEKMFDRFGRTCSKDDIVFSEGDEGKDMYFLLEGTVIVRKQTQHGVKDLITLNPGAFFGEMSLFINEPRSATIVAAENNTRIIRLSPGNFETITKIQPQISIVILQELCRRLRNTTQIVANK